MAHDQHTRRCIPVGCILLRLSDSGIPPALWSLADFKTWSRFEVLRGPEDTFMPDPCLSRTPCLPRDVQEYLVGFLEKPFVQLLYKRWIEMTFCVSIDDPGQAILRVYLLPDDMDRRTVDRSDAALRKARQYLLSQLDFSRSTWSGDVGPSRSPSPLSYDDNDQKRGDEEQSLLEMFNSIPSPNPHPEEIVDRYTQDAAYDLLAGEVAGLKTRLYPYQQRSAAIMLQKESQPETILDPRLVKVADQNGNPWYYDRVNGFGLHEPRYYDGVPGGILAEEMGAGKTLICLALILATKHQTSRIPDIYRGGQVVKRPRVGSLADMAAATVTRNAVPWKPWLLPTENYELDYENCVNVLRRNLGHYYMPRSERKKHTRQPLVPSPPRKIYLSYATLVIVPANLIQQWKQELAKHTMPGSLRTLVITGKQELPPAKELIDCEIILFSSTAFERLGLTDTTDHPLTKIHFKRCIIDEGHKLGNSTAYAKSNLLLVLDSLQISARWVVTGTPAKGLFGVDQSPSRAVSRGRRLVDSSDEQERDDLKRIGAITTLYLKARPWANGITDYGDRPADWSVYVLQPKHSRRSSGRKDCLRATLESLIIRHQLSNVVEMLPMVNEKVVYLEGSYQDRLSLNLFSMVIIFNAVQSQRTDQDYFFHPRQRKALIQLVSNLRQASFFGGPFFPPEAILQAVETSVKFLDERKVAISPEDESLLSDAIVFGRAAADNVLKRCSHTYREIPLYVQNFPGGLGQAWSVDEQPGDPVCTNSPMIKALQRYLRPTIDAPTSLRMLFDSGKFEEQGRERRRDAFIAENQPPPRKGSGSVSASPASKTQPGRGSEGSKSRNLSSIGTPARMEEISVVDPGDVRDIAEPLARTRIISTASAKMSYLIDQIVKYQKDEQIIVFYEDDNVAWYVAGMLEILQIQHLIYSGKIKVERRAQYVATFNQNPKFRVLLMDINQAAFGLDMQSASRIYFINPVLDAQIEAQAVGRARRISQKKPVTVETLVLRGSLEEVIVQRKEEMTRAEQRKCKSILDDRPIYDWILNAKIHPLPEGHLDGPAQTAMLQEPQFIFGRGFGRHVEENEGLVLLTSPTASKKHSIAAVPPNGEDGITSLEQDGTPASIAAAPNTIPPLSLPSRKRKLDSVTEPLMSASPFRSKDWDASASPRPTRSVHFAGDEEN